jgi:Mak16 protein C-terminal region.
LCLYLLPIFCNFQYGDIYNYNPTAFNRALDKEKVGASDDEEEEVEDEEEIDEEAEKMNVDEFVEAEEGVR